MNKAMRLTPRLLTCLVAGLLVSGTTITAQAASSCIGLSGCDRKICEKEYELEKSKRVRKCI